MKLKGTPVQFWVTTQWPHLRSTRRDALHNSVWVASDKRDVIAPMRVGDLVWIYESQSGRTIIEKQANGSERKIRHHQGRGGVVALAEVTDSATENSEAEPERYVDGSSIWWRWRAPTRTVNSAGFLPRTQLNELLGYKASNPLRGFGTRSSGLMEIGPEVHQRIFQTFVESYERNDDERLRCGRKGPRAGFGGEGPVHKALKEAIAADPAGVLGKPGLEFVEMEYPFGATGDQIDVLLRDEFGRYVAVEVEPECPADHIAGPLQCMKYRALLAYHFNRELEEVRTCLVTHRLADAVREKAQKYEIECVQVASVRSRALARG